MPEGVEIRWMARCLAKFCIGKQLLAIRAHSKKEIKGSEDFTPSICREVSSKGKVLFLIFDTFQLVIHFGLTGFLSLDSDKAHVRYTFEFFESDLGSQSLKKTDLSSQSLKKTDLGSQSLKKTDLYYCDATNFGNVYLYTSFEYKETQLGLDLFNPSEFTLEAFQQKIDRNKQNICVFLMNQKKLAGIGNYIKCESLYHAHLSPFRTMDSLSSAEIKHLYDAVQFVMYSCYLSGYDKETYKHVSINLKCSLEDEIGGDPLTKIVPQPKPYVFQVYQRERDGLEVAKTPDGRSTYWMPSVQL